MIDPPSGHASLPVRKAYFRALRSRHFADRGAAAAWLSGGAIAGWLFVAALVGLGH